MRVAIIGARRVRQGLGPYLARFAAEAGAELCAAVGTSMETAEEAVQQIHAATGQAPAGVTDIEGIVNAGAEALIIASPHETHDAWLGHALEHSLHVLCEKPLVWAWGSPDAAIQGRLIADEFVERGLVLRLNTQWPWTLDTFHELHPEAPRVPARFFMQMPPRLTGIAAVIDSASHPLSMLAHWHPDPGARLEDLRVLEGSEDAGLWRLAFTYTAATGTVETEIVLDSSPDEARTTTYALDGFQAARQVEPSTYAMTLGDGDSRIPLPDPTPRLVGSFLNAARSGRCSPIDGAADPGLRHLVEIVVAARRHMRAQQT